LTLQEVQKVLRDIMSEIDRICRTHQIPYTLFCGSMLGAVREKGMIPWDDDMDIRIWRKDYSRLRESLKAELPEHLKLVEPTDLCPNFFNFVPRVCDTRYYWHEPTETDQAFDNLQNHVCVDIFMAISSGDTERTHNRMAHRLMAYHALALGHRPRSMGLTEKPANLIEKIGISMVPAFGRMIPMEKICQRREKWMDRHQHVGGKYFLCVNIEPNNMAKRHYECAWAQEYHPVPFDDRKFMIENGYHEELTLEYGDYMTPVRDAGQFKVHFDEKAQEERISGNE